VDTLSKVNILKDKLFQLSFQTVKEKQLPEEINLLQETSQLPEVCDILQLWKLNDEIILLLCNSSIVTEGTFHRCVIFIKKCLFPKITSLQAPASRVLFTAIVACAKKHPKPILYGLLLPLVADPIMGSSQCEIVNRVLKDCVPPEIVSLFTKALLNIKRNTNDSNLVDVVEAEPAFKWTEFTVMILQIILNRKIALDNETVELMVTEFEEHAELEQFKANLKFTTLIFTLISKYESQVVPYIEALRRAVSKTDTFMTNAAIVKLNKLAEIK